MNSPLPRPKDPPLVLWWTTFVFLVLFSAFFIIFPVVDIATGEYVGGRADYTKDTTTISTLAGLLGVCGIIPMLFAGYVFWGLTKKKRQHEAEVKQWFETNILRFAASQKGQVTAEEIAMEFNIDILRAKEILDALVIQSVAELRVNDSGTLVYHIRGINEDKDHTEKI
jgi:hypothetical protein